MVTSTDKVVGRASIGVTMRGTIYVSGVGASLRAARCRFEGGTERGVEANAGGMAELEACSLGLTAAGMACSVSGPGTSAVLRDCRVEGCAVAGGAHPLSAVHGASLALEGCTVDVDGVEAAVSATGQGAGAARRG